MSKGAVIAMTYSVAKDYLAHNIRCNCISPARVHTPFVDGYLKNNYPDANRKCLKSDQITTHWTNGRAGGNRFAGSIPMLRCSVFYYRSGLSAGWWFL